MPPDSWRTWTRGGTGWASTIRGGGRAFRGPRPLFVVGFVILLVAGFAVWLGLAALRGQSSLLAARGHLEQAKSACIVLEHLLGLVGHARREQKTGQMT